MRNGKTSGKTTVSTALIICGVVALVVIAIAVSLKVFGVFGTAQANNCVSGDALDRVEQVVSGKVAEKQREQEEEARLAREREEAENAARKAQEEAVNTRRNELELDPSRTEWVYEEHPNNVVYLTFDDGPSSLTPGFLDVLDRYGVKATFFVTAQDPDSFWCIGEAYRRGHAIALHTASHDYATIYASDEAYFADLEAIGKIVSDQIGFVPFMVRLPGGSSNTVSADYSSGIMSRVTGELNTRGYQYYDWNISTGDGSVVTAEQAFQNGTSIIGEHDVMLLAHDSYSKQTTLDALPAIIEAYQAAGYEFRTIGRGSYVPHHGIAN